MRAVYNIILSLAVFLISFPLTAQFIGSDLGQAPTNPQDSVLTKRDSLLIRQEVKGYITERVTNRALAGANVSLRNENNVIWGVSTDENGFFRFINVPLGRYTLHVSYVGYNSISKSILVISVKAVQEDIALEESLLYLNDVLIQGENAYTELVSETVLDPADLSKLAGRPEFIRKATNYPGTQSADDSRNDVIVRGNSPSSVIWRMEGINIPNPNHFNIPGTSGGPVSMISDKTLAPSNFRTGAFEALFGNSTSGIFDLSLRSGDTTSHLGSFQFGVLGAELTTEGPLSRKRKSSYLFNVRRSILEITNALNLDLGTPATPVYTDLTFKLNFPVRNGGDFWLFGVGGASDVFVLTDPANPSHNIYGEKDRDQDFHSLMGVVGVGYKSKLKSSDFLSLTLAASKERTYVYHYLKYFEEDLKKLRSQPWDTTNTVFHSDYNESRISGTVMYSQKPAINTLGKSSSQHIFTAGLTFDIFLLNHLDSIRNITVPLDDETYGKWIRRLDDYEVAGLIQPYGQWRYVHGKSSLTSGLHLQYFTLTNSKSIEPRISYAYYINDKSRITAAYGHQSQKQATYVYFYKANDGPDGQPVAHNRNLDFTRSRQLTLGYERKLGPSDSKWRMKLETYYQYLYNVPIDKDKKSDFSMINSGADFVRVFPGPQVNKGIGKNYGIEMTVEKSFADNFLVLLTSSLFSSRYRGSDNVMRNTDFNGRYIVNALASYEHHIRDRNALTAGLRITTTDGRLYGTIDTVASLQQRDVKYSGARNSLRFDPYFRVDLRLDYRMNKKRFTHEISLDMINIFDNKNILKNSYFPFTTLSNGTYLKTTPEITKEYQLGFLPFIYYRVQFRLSKQRSPTIADIHAVPQNGMELDNIKKIPFK